MKEKLLQTITAVAIVFATLCINAFPFVINPFILGGGGGGAPSYLVDEGAEGTGTPASWTGTGTPDWDDATTFFAGAQAVNVSGAASDEGIITPTFAATTDCHVFFMLYINALPSTGRGAVHFRNGTTTHETININSTGTIGIAGGSFTVSAMSTATWYYVWAGYNASTGASFVAFSATSTEPTSGNNFTSSSQAGTTDITSIRFYSDFSTTAGPDMNIDHILVDDADIGNNP